jgi:beta-lactam-binding protein with PASTA domain
VLPLVAVSGAECVEALLQASFVVRSRSSAATTLERGPRVVVVPDVAMLTAEDVEAVLRDAGLAYEELLDLLSESPTDPDVQRASTAPWRPARRGA